MPIWSTQTNYQAPSSPDGPRLFTVRGINVETGGQPTLLAGLLCTGPPSWFKPILGRFAQRRFGDGTWVDRDGSTQMGGRPDREAISGLAAFYLPDRRDVLDCLLQGYWSARRADSPPVGERLQESGFVPWPPHQVAHLIKTRRVLIFTGAGISVAAGVPDMDQLLKLNDDVYEPLPEFFRDVAAGTTRTRTAKAHAIYKMLTAGEPTAAHRLIKALCKQHGCALATGNFDGLHEQTGLLPIYQTSTEVTIPHLETYDAVIAIGLSELGMGDVSTAFRRANPDGQLIAINPSPPSYLGKSDGFVEGRAEDVLRSVITHLS